MSILNDKTHQFDMRCDRVMYQRIIYTFTIDHFIRLLLFHEKYSFYFYKKSHKILDIYIYTMRY